MQNYTINKENTIIMLLTDFPSGSLPRRAWPASHIVRWSEWDDTSADMTMPQVLESYNNIINQPQEHWTVRIVVKKTHSAPVGASYVWKHALLKCVGDVNQCNYCPKVWGMLLFFAAVSVGEVLLIFSVLCEHKLNIFGFWKVVQDKTSEAVSQIRLYYFALAIMFST